ncbi:hypothetical protein NMG60_11001334 [Bertholletia excelsa]
MALLSVSGGEFLQKPLPLIPSTPKPFQPNNLIIRTGPRKPAIPVFPVANLTGKEKKRGQGGQDYPPVKTGGGAHNNKEKQNAAKPK